MDVSEVHGAFNCRVKQFKKKFSMVAEGMLLNYSHFGRCFLGCWILKTKALRSLGTLLPDNTASHPRRLEVSATLLWELKTSYCGITSYRRHSSSKADCVNTQIIFIVAYIKFIFYLCLL